MSSVVTIQVGQCGNQVGAQLFDTLHAEAMKGGQAFRRQAMDRFFRSEREGDVPTARAVLIDMEPKVIAGVMTKASKGGKWRYDPKGHFSVQSGSGNNWAFGYNVHGPRHSDAMLELVRKEAEKCDIVHSFLLLMSLAGGTGSGVGTFLSEAMRDQYPHAHMLHQPVWPFEDGEVIVQNYNALLSLSHLCGVSDAMILMANDQLHLACTRLLQIKQVSFSDMNSVMAHHLAAVLLPYKRASLSQTPTPSSASSFAQKPHTDTGSEPNDVNGHVHEWLSDAMLHLCSHPAYKLLSLKSVPMIAQSNVPFSTYVWPAMVKRLFQMQLTDAKIDEGIDWTLTLEEIARNPTNAFRRVNKSVSSLLVLRGSESHAVDPAPLMAPGLYTNWSAEPLRVGYHPCAFNNYEKSATLLSNSQSVVVPLNKMVSKAYEMYLSKAYMHQYARHGIVEDDFVRGFVQLENVLEDYKQL